MNSVSIFVTSNLQDFHSERRFPLQTSIKELKNKLELLTGASASSMKLEVKNKDGDVIKQLGEANATLADYEIADGTIIHVTGTAPKELPTDSFTIPKFELTQEEYAKRQDSVRTWKQQNQFGNFDPDAEKRKQQKEEQIVHESESLAKNMNIGERCKIEPERRGTIMFVGTTHFRPGFWVGIKLDEPFGKNDGSVDGKRYFECPPQYGVFVRPQNVTIGSFPEAAMEEI